MTELNGVMMQYFQWYLPNDGIHWQQIQAEAPALANAGFTALWLPPAYKGHAGIDDVGYSPYDLFDLGEFEQKGAVRTKYGTREEYLAAVRAVQAVGMQVYADVVFSHKTGGDVDETLKAVPVDRDDRNQAIGPMQSIQACTTFTFPGRNSKYSNLTWTGQHFDSVHHNLLQPDDSKIYGTKPKTFETELNHYYGSEEFQLACAIDTDHPTVQEELKRWGEWIVDTTGIDGFRFEGANHVRPTFFSEWLAHVRRYARRKLFAVGDYWAEDVEALHSFISRTGGQLALFDVPLHYNFHRASRAGGHFDLRRLLFGTLMREQPPLAVTFVENHNSQPLRTLESVVEPWFKPLAYALILLRREGYPCVFYGDYYGGHYVAQGRDRQPHEIWLNSHRFLIDKFLYARKHYAHGPQYDYFDHPDCLGWTRLGTPEFPKAMAVVLSDAAGGAKWMEVGKPNAIFRDLTEHIPVVVRTNDAGWGDFWCLGGSVSVWVEV